MKVAFGLIQYLAFATDSRRFYPCVALEKGAKKVKIMIGSILASTMTLATIDALLKDSVRFRRLVLGIPCHCIEANLTVCCQEVWVKQEMGKYDASHDYMHAFRVRRNALTIAEK